MGIIRQTVGGAYAVQAVSTVLAFGFLSGVLLTAPDQDSLSIARFVTGFAGFIVIMVGGPAINLWLQVREDRNR